MTAQPTGPVPPDQQSGPDSGSTVETYRLDTSRTVAVRSVVDRVGREHQTYIGLAAGEQRSSPADTYEATWLRSTPMTPSTGRVVTAADLFSGCGGLGVGVAEACQALGATAHHVFAADVDVNALGVFGDNFPDAHLVAKPIETLLDGDIGETPTRTERRLSSMLAGLTIAVGGPPCQGNSDLNNHTRRADPKNALYLKMVRFAEVVRPTHLLVENVPGVVHDKKLVVGHAEAALSDLGYRVSTAVVAAAELGVPQSRRRHLLLATLDDGSLADAKVLAQRFASNRRPALWAIEDLIGVDAGASVFDTPASHSQRNRARIDYLFDHDVYDLPDGLRPDCHRLKPHSYKAVYGRMHPDRPAPTITSGFGSTGQGRFVHPLLRRTLTPHEAARLQGFPDSFSFRLAPGRRSLQQMIGNAVHSRLGYAATLDLLR